MYGFFKQRLTVDVSNRSFQAEALSDTFLRACMGGKGLGTQLLLDNNPVGVDPFSPDNHFVLALGPATDSPLHGSCRHGIYAKSPLTGLYSESYSGRKCSHRHEPGRIRRLCDQRCIGSSAVAGDLRSGGLFTRRTTCGGWTPSRPRRPYEKRWPPNRRVSWLSVRPVKTASVLQWSRTTAGGWPAARAWERCWGQKNQGHRVSRCPKVPFCRSAGPQGLRQTDAQGP